MRGWDTHLPGRMLGALPTRQWVKRLQQLGRGLVVRRWRQVEGNSPATRRRWQWTWVGDDRVFNKPGRQLGLVGPWYRGQEHRVRLGIEGLLLLGVSGAGQLVIPVDVAVRRPDPAGCGRPCRDNLTWLQVMRDRTWAAWPRRGPYLPPPLVVAESGCGDSQAMAQVASHQQGPLVVEGKRRDVFPWPDGRRVTGQDLRARTDWAWRDRPQVPGRRYARLTATSPTSGAVTVVILDAPGEERSSLRCQATSLTAPRLIRAWKRRRWMDQPFRPRKPLRATAVCPGPGEDAYYGPLGWRLLAGFILLYTARVLVKGRMTMEEILFPLTHDWRFLDSALLEFHGLSWDLRPGAA